MTATTLFQAWNHRYLGTATLTFSDSGGGPYTISLDTTVNSGLLSHVDLSAVDPKDRRGATLDLGVHAVATELQTLMQAAGASPTVSFSQSTMAYTFASITALNFPATTAGTLMRRLLGFSTSPGSVTSATSTITPWFCWRPAIDGRAQYDQPVMVADQFSRAFADDGVMYSVGPVRPVREARWAHQFEAKADIQRRFSGVDDWTAEDFLEHAGQNAAPCIIVDDIESMVFYAGAGFERGALARSRPDSDLNQIIRVNAERVLGWL